MTAARLRALAESVAREAGAQLLEAFAGPATGWIVDPLDGTTNFLFGIPQWAVSIAVEDADGMLAGVVYDPPRGEMWSAQRDGPPMLDGVPVCGSGRTELATALIATGFGYDVGGGDPRRDAALLGELRSRVA